MAKCSLTDRQKDLIRSLAPGLRNGTIETEWAIFTGGDRIQGIMGLGHTGELWREVWKEVKFSDFAAFVKCGLFTRTSTGGYILYEAEILDAVDRNFADDDQAQSAHITISGGDFRGAIVNAASTLTNVQQSIGAATPLSDDTKAQLTDLIEQLKEALSDVPEEDAEEAEVLAHHAQVAVDQLNSGKPNKRLLSISVDGLEQAAKNIKRVGVPVVEFAAKIALILRPFTM